MLLKKIKTFFTEELKHIYPQEEIESMFYYALEEILGLNRFILLTHPDMMVATNETQHFLDVLARLKQEEPIQYIFGKAYFMDLKLRVTPDTLIPRPETEELVHWIFECYSKEDPSKLSLKILDLGTGTGCIPIALAKRWPKSMVGAVELEAETLKVAQQNASDHEVEIEWYHGSMSEDFLQFEGVMDIIVSNPPYVRALEKQKMNKNVLDYEPERALYVSDEAPLFYYEIISNQAIKWLKEGGLVFVEINQYLAQETRNLFVDKGFVNVELRKDIFDNFRLLKATYTTSR